jgi:hypothetical protein
LEDGRKNNGGHRTAGRKSKVDEDKKNFIFMQTIKQLHSKDNDDEAKVEFLKDLAQSERGKMFIAEHIFGKAPQEVKNTNLNLDEKDLTPEIAITIKKIMENDY